MKKVIKILAVTLIAIALMTLVAYLYYSELGRRDILTGAPNYAKHEIPVIYNIGWWTYQDSLEIESFNVEIEESRLNLFNAKSLISYRIIGNLRYKHWPLTIEAVHISERTNSDTTYNYDRIIEITPIAKSGKHRENGENRTDRFEFKNEHLINSDHWGINRIKFICGTKEQIIELRQAK